MSRYLVLTVLLLSGCGVALPHTYTRSPTGHRIATSKPASDYLFLNPFCVSFCNSAVTAAASTATGQGNSNTQSPTTSQSQGEQRQ